MLVMAIFIILVLSFLALAIIQIGGDSSRSIVYEVYGSRALHAANSGADRALSDIFGPGVATPNCDNVNNQTYQLPNSTVVGFSGCSLATMCNEFYIAQTGFTHYRITSTASCSAGEINTKRSVAVEARIKLP